MQAMRIPQTHASRGLIALRDAGLLKARRDGLWVMYSIDEENLHKFAPNLAQVIRSALAASELAMLDRERLKTATKDGPCKLRLRSLGLE
jgi:ArsR family transcriptional regulator, arsenate/arsenite/antimonite-responsive transcriptional repressor